MADPNDPNPQKPLDVFPPEPGDPDWPGAPRGAQGGSVPPPYPSPGAGSQGSGFPHGGFSAGRPSPTFPGIGSVGFGAVSPAPPPPMPPTQPGQVAQSSDFNERRDHEGNYLLTIGNPGSGKSTFQRHLAMDLLTSGDYTAELITGADWGPRRIVTEWQREWITQGSFPKANVVDNIDEFHFRMTPRSRRNLPLDFRFVEIAGEHFVDLMELKGTSPSIPVGLSYLLANPSVKLIVALTIDGAVPPGRTTKDRALIDDLVFVNFLALVGQLRPPGSAPDIKVMIIVSKPEAAIGLELGRASPDSPERRQKLFEFAYQKIPSTWNVLKDANRKIPSQVFGMSIGVSHGEGASGRIVKPNFRDTHKIMGWAYRHFTGKPMQPWHQRFLASLAGGAD